MDSESRRSLFPFRKRSLPFLTVDANKPLVMIDVIYKENNTFLNSLKKNDVEAHVEFTVKEKLWKGLGHLLLMYQLRKTVR